MISLQTIRRITVYAAQDLEKPLLDHCLALGAKGYTVVEARGVGTHAAVPDPFSHSSHVRIELLVRPETAGRIFEYLNQLHTQNRPVTACVDDVQVADPEHY